MMYINSRSWIFLFLFYGAVGFLVGFFGYWLKTDKPQSTTTVRAPISQEQIGTSRNLMVESEEYFTKLLTRLNLAISDVPKTDTGIINNSGETNEAVPVSANTNPAKLVFCFPEGYHSGVFQSLIARYRFTVKTSFTGVKEISVREVEHWVIKLGEILNREQPQVLIGFNLTQDGLTRPGLPDSGCERVNVHLYFAMADQWQGILLPQIIARFSGNLDSFTLEKRKSGDREVFEIIWTEATEEHFSGLERNLASLVKTLEQVPELRTARKI